MPRILTHAFILFLCVAPAAGQIRVFHSAPDSGAASTTAVTIESGTTDSLYLYVDSSGAPSSDPSAICDSGDGDELCGLALWLEASGALGFSAFVPDPSADLVFQISPTDLRINFLDSFAPMPGLRRLGELQVSATAMSCGGTCEVQVTESIGVGAALQVFATDLATPSPVLMTLPEPSFGLLVGIGSLAVLLLASGTRRTRVRIRTRFRLRPALLALRLALRLAPRRYEVHLALIGLLGVITLSQNASAQLVYLHEGANDPAIEGWGITPGDNGASSVTVAPAAPDPSDGLDAWIIDDFGTNAGSRLRYEVPIDAIKLGQAEVQGWTLRLILRVAEPPGSATDAVDASIIAEVSEGPGAQRYALVFGTDPNDDGDPVVSVFGGTGTISSGPASYTVEGAGDSYQEYALSLDPATGEASVWVNGIRRISTYAGIAAGTVAPRLNWGSGQSGTTGSGYYRLVEWSLNTDADQDGVPDLVDNCPSFPNPENLDTGAVGAGTPPDGIGDACQCADLDLDGTVDGADLARYRQALVDPVGSPLNAEELARCGVLGSPTDCDLAEVVALARATAGLGPGIGQSCIAAQAFEPMCGDGVCSSASEDCRSCTTDCGSCLIGDACVEHEDCASDSCQDGFCASITPVVGTPLCGDGICEGKETCSRVGLYGCYDDCGPCLSANFEHCNENADCDGPGQCVLQGQCTQSNDLCPIDDSIDDCPVEDDYCSISAFGVVVFGGLCSDFVTPCHTGAFGFPIQDVCDDGDICRRRQICNPPQVGSCGAPPAYVNQCENGEGCAANEDCQSGVCYQMYVPIAGDFISLCTSPLADGFPCTESNDCQGLCNFGFCQSNPLPDGSPCTLHAACQSGICNGFCAAAPLPNGTPCVTSTACASGLCLNGVCSMNDCGDGICNTGFESCSTPDPGAPFGQRCQADCGACEDGQVCFDDTDCQSGQCDPFIRGCLACRWTNDGSCSNGERCDEDLDCATGNCVGEETQPYGACAPVPNACSGSSRPNGCGCSANGDCASNDCQGYDGSNWCVPNTCTAPGESCSSSGQCCDFPGSDLGCFDQNPLPILTSFRCALGPA